MTQTPPDIDIQDLLRRYNLRPNKRLGQNFLVDQVSLRRVVEAADLSEHDTVLEIGPGLGSLTRLLAALAGRVVAVELDVDLIPALMEVLTGLHNVQVVQGDILAINLAELIGVSLQNGDVTAPGYLVVANIPYYITSALIRHLLEAPRLPRSLVLTVQQEVAERICSRSGESSSEAALSLLALSVQVYGEPHIKAQIPAGAFFPPPTVDSAVVRIDLYPAPLIPAPLLPGFFRLAKAGFSQKRKTLRNALSAGMHWSTAETAALLANAGVDPNRRAETLSMDEWQNLTSVVAYQSML
jgi:16S rRNA (adenine1518-N6/adenine1519-N6)-dimethyltransferase